MRYIYIVITVRNKNNNDNGLLTYYNINVVSYPAITMKKSNLFQESARYVQGPYAPMAIIFTIISSEKNANMKSSNTCKQLSLPCIRATPSCGKHLYHDFNKNRKNENPITCRILHLLDMHWSSTHGWYMPKVTQFSSMTSMLALSNHVYGGWLRKQCLQDVHKQQQVK